VLDQRLAGMPGIQLARRLRERGFAGPIVLHSVDADDIADEADALDLHTLPTDDFGQIVAHFAEQLESRERVRRES
jgi:CheY-like chemotaxis protein